MVDFGGWAMPINYGSQIEEHHWTRNDAALFDVSHMTVVDITGRGARTFLQYLLANDVARLKTSGKALYSCMLNEQGGVIDDLIVYHLQDDFFRVVVNASTREKDLAWMRQQIEGFDAQLTECDNFAMLAIQGPDARARVIPLLAEGLRTAATELQPFHAVLVDDWFIARTGYTGEDGFEVVMPATEVVAFWQALLAVGVHPCGLGARDTLRLEAGMRLYGADMDETISPLEAGLEWTVAWQPETRDFIGRSALEQQKKSGVSHQLQGLLLQDRGVLRNHQKVITASGEGEITSGGFSPTLQQSIAFARLPTPVAEQCQVDIRGRLLSARVVKLPFVRNGKSCIA